MGKLLMTVGDSFTFGEALQFHLWKSKYPTTFNRFKGKERYDPCHSISEDFIEFDDFRRKTNYTGQLSSILGITYAKNSGNGGNNLGSLELLDRWIEHTLYDKSFQPELVVFQFTNIIRDVIHLKNMNDGNRGPYNHIFEKVKTILSLIDNINQPSTEQMKNMASIFADFFYTIVLEVQKRFSILENEFGTKCIYFIGSAEQYSKQLYHSLIQSDIHYLPIIYKENLYTDWDTMNRQNGLTIRLELGVNDDHPTLDSHQYITNLIYKKYLDISK
jgi:hypothetical protein